MPPEHLTKTWHFGDMQGRLHTPPPPPTTLGYGPENNKALNGAFLYNLEVKWTVLMAILTLFWHSWFGVVCCKSHIKNWFTKCREH